ncbi:MAG TPA: pyridoxamine 5'-phosphate oxidase family protein [Chloroflexota bacterium]
MAVEELGGLVDLPLLATLATYRRDGSVLLSPVWHEWRDGGFLIVLGRDDVKTRHLQNDPRACVVLAENEPPYRGLEVSGMGVVSTDPATALQAFQRIAIRYLGAERGRAFAGDNGEAFSLLQLTPGRLRTWDFVDDPQLAA